MKKPSPVRWFRRNYFYPRLDRLEDRNPPSDTLSVLLAQLGSWHLLGGALSQFGDVPTFGDASTNVPLARSAATPAATSSDLADPLAVSPCATPRPLTQWLDDDFVLPQS